MKFCGSNVACALAMCKNGRLGRLLACLGALLIPNPANASVCDLDVERKPVSRGLHQFQLALECSAAHERLDYQIEILHQGAGGSSRSSQSGSSKIFEGKLLLGDVRLEVGDKSVITVKGMVLDSKGDAVARVSRQFVMEMD